MISKSFLGRWALRSAPRRDREFYLLALPVTVSCVGLAPHIMQLILIPGSSHGLLWLSSKVVVGAALVGIICYAITRFLSRPSVWGHQRDKWPLVTHLLILWTPTAILVDAPLRFSELTMVGIGRPSADIAPYILGISMGRTFLFAGGIVFYERLMGAATEAADQRQRALKLEAQTLKNLIQPHFLLNSLNAVRAYMEDSPKIAEEMLLRLTSLLQRVIQYSAMDRVSLADEIVAIRDYVDVMNRRFEGNVRLLADEAVAIKVKIPPLILFSLVENSFKHGFSEKHEGNITIRVEAGDRLKIVVEDDGEPSHNSSYSGGLGGHYVESRLELAYGDDFLFVHGRKDDGRYEATIEIPWEGA